MNYSYREIAAIFKIRGAESGERNEGEFTWLIFDTGTHHITEPFVFGVPDAPSNQRFWEDVTSQRSTCPTEPVAGLEERPNDCGLGGSCGERRSQDDETNQVR